MSVRQDRGSFTVELAGGLPALVLLLLFGLTAISAVTARGRCVDAAREGAIIEARGGPGADRAAGIAPPGATVTIAPDAADPANSVTVTVEAPIPVLGGSLPRLTVRARAVAAREPVIYA
ncbi:TadE family type IV pilus minor pilin [Winogradskya humida]|uniref:TadE-like domain-containing protein n=1 Tax=Winogradskya humida TaxID=113566 RepID=A0ABQ3ZM41_9ACTN|nr:TadE family type IV pilus minor pilin [Actinoplanes humidus]GIE19655.1 hypothetical protein Ahu01nite_027570 [Actinoplanes humidus]